MWYGVKVSILQRCGEVTNDVREYAQLRRFVERAPHLASAAAAV
jgi:hypothetical protein